MNELAENIENSTIIVDEANLDFMSKKNSIESRTALALFTQMTEETTK